MRLREYWPPFLQEVEDFDLLAKAEQPEFDKWAEAVQQLPEDFFLSTLSEYGVERWEAILGLQLEEGQPLEERRRQIQIAYGSSLPYTYRSLLNFLHSVHPEIQSAIVFYLYLLRVDVPYGLGQMEAIRKTLREMVPANMVVEVASAAAMEASAGAALGFSYGYMRF